MKRYELGDTGWVGHSPKTIDGKTMHHWWDGPGHASFFISLSPLGPTTAVYPSRQALVNAARKAGANVKPQKVADAETLVLSRWIAWWERVCREAEIKPDNRLLDKTVATRWKNRYGSQYTRPEEIALWRAQWVYAREQLEATA